MCEREEEGREKKNVGLEQFGFSGGLLFAVRGEQASETRARARVCVCMLIEREKNGEENRRRGDICTYACVRSN